VSVAGCTLLVPHADASGRSDLQLTLSSAYLGNYTFIVYAFRSGTITRLITVCTQARDIAQVRRVGQ
jgi:hypothetical protein